MKSTPRSWTKPKWFASIFAILVVVCGIKAFSDTMATPLVMRTNIALQSFPAEAPPITIALISDIHIAGPDMPPERLGKIVEQINALSPDYLLVAGDFISEKRTATRIYTAEEAIAPFKELDDRIAKIAVPGNHDHWFDLPALNAALEKADFRVLVNDAVRAGPLVIGGLDDDFTGRADLTRMLAAMSRLEGGRIALSHSPDPFPDLPADFGLMLAGHTHCGQIRYPWGGSPASMSDYGDRYACGRVDENGNTVITGAGLGTSLLPIRFFSKPEIWLITVSALAV